MVNNNTGIVPIINICCITFNHEFFIAQALDGFLKQKTSFPFNIIIHDDASNDKTVDIIKKYIKNYPHLISPIFQKENQFSKGINPALMYVIPKCNGKYIAFCEGDDYWIDEYKLQKQIDFLEKNDEFGMVCTSFDAFFEESNKMIYGFGSGRYKDTIGFDEYLLDRSSIGTATVVVRRSILLDYLKVVDPLSKNWGFVGDTPIYLYFAKFSKIKYFDFATAVYRKNINSACRFTDVHKKFDFIIKGYQIPLYFVERFGALEKTIKTLKSNFHRMYIKYAYEIGDPSIAKFHMKWLKEDKSLKLNDKIMYQASKRPQFKSAFVGILWIINLIKRIEKKASYVLK